MRSSAIANLKNRERSIRLSLIILKGDRNLEEGFILDNCEELTLTNTNGVAKPSQLPG